MEQKNLETKIELLKKDIDIIKNNHLVHMSKDIDDLMSDVKELKRMIFKAQYIMYGAIVVFVLMSDKFTEIFKLLQEKKMAKYYPPVKRKGKGKKEKKGKC